MSFDFTAALNTALAATNNPYGENGEKKYRYPLVYPQPGQTMTIRLLFNPASHQFFRKIYRHETENSKIACYRTYATDCPICQVMEEVKATTATDPFGRKQASRERGICFAQFISSALPVKKGSDANSPVVQPGEYILLMYPKSVYQQLNAIIQVISQVPNGMDNAFSHADKGCFLQINVSNDGKYTYTVTQVPYMEFPTNQTDEDFTKMLDGMESLNDMVLPSTITEEVAKQVEAYRKSIYDTYLAPRIPNKGIPTASATPVTPTATYSTTGVPYPNQSLGMTVNTVPPTPVTTTPSDHPACYGKHQENNPQCICCPDEINCKEANLPF